MQLKQLAYYATVIEHSSFSKAADNLFISQSSLSQSIKALEKELGFTLLNRSSKGVTPTDIGNIVYSGVKKILSTVEEQTAIWEEIHQQRSALKGKFRIASVPCSYFILKEIILKSLEETYPNIKCTAMEVRKHVVISYLKEHQVDLILSNYTVREKEEVLQFAKDYDMKIVELLHDSYKIGVSTHNPKSKKQCLSAADACQLPLACYSGGDAAADLFFQQNFDKSMSIEYNSFERLMQTAIDNQVVSILPELTTQKILSLQSSRKDTLRFLAVEGFSIPITHYICFHKDLEGTKEFAVVRDLIENAYINLSVL